MLRIVTVLLFLSVSAFSQGKSNTTMNSGSFHFNFNTEPDSVFLNGDLHESVKGIRYALPAGKYMLRVVKECYEPFEKEIVVVAKTTELLKVQLNKLNVPETRSFKRSLYYDLGMAASGAVLVSTLDKGTRYALPAVLTGLLSYGLWRRRMKKDLDLCSGAYSGPVPDGGGWRLRFGVAANASGASKHNAGSETEYFYDNPNGPSAQFNYTFEADLIKNNDATPSESFSYSLALEKPFSEYLSVSFYGQYLPQTSLQLNYRENRLGSSVTSTAEFQDEGALIMYGIDFLVMLNRSPNHQVSFVFGGYNSNSISGAVEQPLTIPSSIPESPTVELNYEYSIRGVKAGLRADFWLWSNTGLWTTYELLAIDKLSVLNDSKVGQQFVFQMGFMREF